MRENSKQNQLYQVALFLSCFFLCLNFISCKKDNDVKQDSPSLTVKNSIGFTEKGGQLDLEVKSNVDWSINTDKTEKWLMPKKVSSTKISVTAEVHDGPKSRTTSFEVLGGGKHVSVMVIQTGSSLELKVNPSELTINSSGEENLSIEVLANTEYKIIMPEGVDWIQEKTKTYYRSSDVTTTHKFIVAPNLTAGERKSSIFFISTENEKIKDECVIVQKAASSEVGDIDDHKDEQLKVTDGIDTDHEPGYDISKSFDGKYGGNSYHSGWQRKAHFPVTLEYFFKGNTIPLDYIIYHTRNGNGNFGAFKLYIKTSQDNEYKEYASYDFKGAGGNHRILIDNAPVPVAVKFVVTSGLNDFVSCDEMEFFHKKENPINQKLLEVFTDLSCESLRQGVQNDAINKLPSFFKILAEKLKNKTYPAEEKRFRMQTYKAYSVPEYWADKLRTNSYSHLNNPTGIILNKGEQIIVLASGLPNTGAVLRCCSYIGPRGEDKMITNGVNKLSYHNGGHLFVIYETRDPKNSPSIHVHIPPQTMKGEEIARVGYNLWDIDVDKTDEKYREYLEKNITFTAAVNNEDVTQSIFFIKGHKVVFTFNKTLLINQERLKNHGVILAVERWDKLVTWEQDLANVTPFCKSGEFNNLMHVCTFPSGMYATQYYINIQSGENLSSRDGWGIKNSFDPRDMDKEQDRQWGPGHELGHMHQGAINWPSTTESSNNLFSNYVVYQLKKWGSRGSSVNELAKRRYAPTTAWARFMHPFNNGTYNPFNYVNSEQANSFGLYQGEDSEMHMRLNQQLWTYFDRIGTKPGTFNKIFDQGRTSNFMIKFNNPGEAQFIFAKNVAHAVQMDMTEFFDAWGFFEPVQSFNLWEYGTFNYQVTQQMIDETKNYMKQFNTKCPPIEYIEDRVYRLGAVGRQRKYSEKGGDVGYFETFKNKVKIDKTVSYTKNGKTFTVKNGQQAVAFELRTNGERIWFSNRFNFTVPESVNISGAELYAVQYDGKRIKMLQE